MVADLELLAADLGAGRITEASARNAAAKIHFERAAGRQAAALVTAAGSAYESGRTSEAWARATIADAVLKAWSGRPMQILRGGGNDDVLDLRARALTTLGFIEADAGRELSSRELSQESELVLARMRNSSRARLAIAVTTAERAVRQGRADDAVAVMEVILRNPRLDDSQRAAAQAVLAGSLRLAGRKAEGIATVKATAESFARAGRPSAVIEADLERGIHLMQAGDKNAARLLLSEVAEAAATSRHHTVEVSARLRLGLLAAEAREHSESAQQFQLAAAAARRVNDAANVVVALRNAGDELRLQHDFVGAERLLNEALAINATPMPELDLAQAKVIFAIVRHEQGQRDEANRLLNEAETTFQRRLDELGHGESQLLRDHLEVQLRQVDSVRARVTNQPK